VSAPTGLVGLAWTGHEGLKTRSKWVSVLRSRTGSPNGPPPRLATVLLIAEGRSRSDVVDRNFMKDRERVGVVDRQRNRMENLAELQWRRIAFT
jgi:hypothetical protein